MVGGPRQSTSGFGDKLADCAGSILAEARTAISATGLSDAETVHEVRKALKRWRALMRLLGQPLGARAKNMRAEARELMRAIAGARDLQAAMDALADIAKGEHNLSPRSLETIRSRLTDLRGAAEATHFTPEMRARIAAYLDRATQSIAQWPLDTIAFDTIVDGLTATYRRARRLVPDDWKEADGEHLHELRRRVVEHRHQMDLVEPLWPRLGKVWGEEAQRLRNQLGACQDLVVLSRFTAPHQPLAPWRSRLTPAVAARQATHIKNAARLASRLFAEKPRAFHSRISALWSARKRQKH